MTILNVLQMILQFVISYSYAMLARGICPKRIAFVGVEFVASLIDVNRKSSSL